MFERNGHTNNAKLSQGFSSGAHRVLPIKVKVRRTYGWLCPYKDYRSNRWSNAQRHINTIHEGAGNPVDSRTGETRDQKIANALNRSNMPNILSGYRVPHLSVISADRSNERSGARIDSSQAQLPVTEFGNFQNPKDVTLSPVAGSSCPMPFLDAQAKRVKELGYDVPIRSQKDIPSSIEKPRSEQQRVFSSPIAGNFPGDVNSALNKPNNEKPININVHRDIHKDSYHDPSDHVDLLAPFDPQMAYCQQMRKFLDQFKS
ncbi:MAG: hypothetical protein GEU26_10230 [Nitrososphaeraceae archaeon]|nr:hypothetical protein [Nitrososphaeraceae archaeon]